ncbi:hypothetical protein ACFGQG_002155 [Salmonella enterica]
MANSSVLNTSRQIFPVLSLLAGLIGSTVTAAGEGPGLQTIPPGYHLVASESGVPAEALYSVSLAETSRKLPHGERPWPWTLNVAGKGYRYNTRQEAYDALLSFMRRYRSFLKKNHPTELERYDEACEALRREEFARFAELQTLGLYLHLQVQQKEAQFRRRRNRLLLGMTITGVMTSVLLYANFYPEQLQLISHELATLPGRISGFVGRLLH